MSELTEEQIENWRRVLYQTLGPYAFFMPAADIQKRRDEMQAEANKWGDEDEVYDDSV